MPSKPQGSSLANRRKDSIRHSFIHQTFTEFSLPLSPVQSTFDVLYLYFDLLNLPWYHYAHFTVEEFKAQRGEVTCSKSHSWGVVGVLSTCSTTCSHL